MVYYWDGDRNVYIQVTNPDNSVGVAVQRVQGTNTIRGNESSDIQEIKDNILEEMHKNGMTNIPANMERIDILLENARREGGREQEITVANDILLGMLEQFYQQPEPEPEPPQPAVMANAAATLNAEFAGFGF